MPSGHLPALLSGTSDGFYRKNHVVLGEMRTNRTATTECADNQNNQSFITRQIV